MYLPNPTARAGWDTRSIFKQSLTGSNSEFSFKLPYQGLKSLASLQLIYNKRENNWILIFRKYISAMRNANSLVQGFELGSLCPFPATLIIPLRLPQYVYIYIERERKWERESVCVCVGDWKNKEIKNDKGKKENISKTNMSNIYIYIYIYI